MIVKEFGELAFLSPNGQRIAYGHHQVFLIDDLDTGVERFVCEGYCAGWYDDAVVAVSRNVTLPDGSPGRTLTYVDVDTLDESLSGLLPYQQPGYQPREAVAHHSRIVSSQHQGEHFIAGILAPWTEPTAARIEHRDSHCYVYKLREGDPWPVIVRGFDGHLEARIDLPLMNTRLDRLDGGTWVSANLNGQMFVRDPYGNDQVGPLGESRGLVFDWRGERCVVTGVIEADANGTPVPVWIVRQLYEWKADAPARVIRGIGLEGMSVRLRGDDLLCIGYVEAFAGRLMYDTLDLAQPWAPYMPATPPLPDIVIIPQRAIWRGSLSGVVRGNCGNERTAQHLIEDARYVTAADEPRLIAVFCDTQMPAIGLQPTIDMAKRNLVPVVLDDDGRPSKAEELHQMFVSAGLRVIRARQYYPIVGETSADYLARCMSNTTACVIRPGYTASGTWPEAQVADCNLVLNDVIAAKPHVIMDLCFGLDRPPRSQWCADFFQALVDATPGTGPTLRQDPVPVEPPIPPPVVIVVPPPTPKPPRPKPPQPEKPNHFGGWKKGLK